MMHGNIAPVDLAQATIGPGMAVYSRYAKVLEPNGTPLRVRTALQIINAELDSVLAEQEGEYDSDTRFCLAWFEQFSMNAAAFGEADVLARGKNTSVAGLAESGVLEAKAGKVRLLKREELPNDWNPATDTRRSVWETCQHLIKVLYDNGSETQAARLLAELGGDAEAARDLAYRLYSICERKGWAQEALAYNSLVMAWSEVTKLSANLPSGDPQGRLEME
jgi:putative DNA methylase